MNSWCYSDNLNLSPPFFTFSSFFPFCSVHKEGSCLALKQDELGALKDFGFSAHLHCSGFDCYMSRREQW